MDLKINIPFLKIKSRKPANTIVFIDTEVSPASGKILDYGAVTLEDQKLHTKAEEEFAAFTQGYGYVCGHNILEHDLKYLKKQPGYHFRDKETRTGSAVPIDTLYLSPLLFPGKPYHALVKDDKLQTEELNNPLNDAMKAKDLFFDECNAYFMLPESLQMIYYLLLHKTKEFAGFFLYTEQQWEGDVQQKIQGYFYGRICEHAPMDFMIRRHPVELAYCLAILTASDRSSVIPHWVHIRFPYIETMMRQLRGIPCTEGCVYCRKELNIKKRLKAVFGYDDFRTYDGSPLQEDAVAAAVRQESLLAIFPTGGGKSLTFQLPALIAGDVARELTVVISPLQSLMKDQVDNLEKRGIADAVTINGLLSPLERAEALERVENGLATILYISPEMLRSRTIERLLLSRSIARFVIDEAHCFSAWGQDFRVDYLYIGDFIKELQEKKGRDQRIPVSCFTATAKQKVISDIKDYFMDKLGIELQIFATSATRKNLRYKVLHKETDEEKYAALRNLIEQKNCPTIVYVSRTKRTRELAERLCRDGFTARPFNGKMESSEKAANQEAFIEDRVQIIVATSAFGMGVDKSNVKLVIHYDISDSLENYVQEAGRAGRDPSLEAECYVLFHDDDLDKHFMLLNQTKLSISEIQQVWKAIKSMTGTRAVLRRSPLEIARRAGWDENVLDVETRVKTAVQALENAGYLRRGKNVPHVYATSILVPNMAEAAKRIDTSRRMDARTREYAKRILKMLISKRSIANAGNDEAESRIDYISDILGIEKADVIDTVNTLREERILADTKDLTAYIKRTDTQNKTGNILKKYLALERFLLSNLEEEGGSVNLKELNEKAMRQGIKTSSVNAIKTVFYFWTIKNYMKKTLEASSDRISFLPKLPFAKLEEFAKKRGEIAGFITEYLFERSREREGEEVKRLAEKEEALLLFSVLELKEHYEKSTGREASEKEIEDALLFLSKTDALRLEGGFLVLYNGMEIERLVMDNKIRYKIEDYRQLNEFYQQKIQQIHIVGEYANMMVRDYDAALQFVSDYFQMDYRKFLNKYFKGERSEEIERNITPEKYEKLFQELSPAQRNIIRDKQSQYIVVAAGPGSGKTKVLVHKLAALLLLEDVKHEQLLMVTFSRAAATEFQQRLYDLIGNAAAFVEIKTFHSFCFDLLGKVGRLEEAKHVVREAADMISNGDVEIGKITKTVVVIDEAQDMDENEFALITAMMEKNEEMRVIAVGDDDQNIYEFRGSDSKYLQSFIEEKGAVKYELLENYRSTKAVVSFANIFAAGIKNRMKGRAVIPVRKELGRVRLIRHISGNLEEAVVGDLLETAGDSQVCVLTNTNKEALKVLGLLLKHGKKAKLIQSNDGFNLYHVVELRFFLQMIKKRETSPVISGEAWEEGKQKLKERYQNSDCLPACLKLLETFEGIYEKKYRTDFEEFIRESKWEDFYEKNQETIIVSTIHKSKGREFDKVYLLLDHVGLETDEERRKLYVGITRAKQELYVHYNDENLDRLLAENISKNQKFLLENFMEGIERKQDRKQYLPADELISQLSHKDIYLGFFQGKQRQMLQLYSGMELFAGRDGLFLPNGQRGMLAADSRVLWFSKKYQEEMEQIKRLGYVPVKAKIRFVLTWRGKEDKAESVIILPDIYYRKSY